MNFLDPRESIWPGLVSGLCLAVIMAALEQPEAIVITAVVAWLCMLWWIFEPLPIPVTSLLPIAVFPISGVLTSEQVGASVGSPLICYSGAFCSPAVWKARAPIIALRCPWLTWWADTSRVVWCWDL